MHAAKRWMARAVLRPEGYLALPATLVGALESFWTRLAAAAGAGPILLGFDFPIGLPAAYAERVGIADFLEALDGFGGDFYEVATDTGADRAEAAVLPAPPRRTEPPAAARRPRTRALAAPAPTLRSLDLRAPGCLPDVLDARRQSGGQGGDHRLARPAGAGAAGRPGPGDLALRWSAARFAPHPPVRRRRDLSGRGVRPSGPGLARAWRQAAPGRQAGERGPAAGVGRAFGDSARAGAPCRDRDRLRRRPWRR